MTFTPDQISELERRMEEEHRKDREAIERLKRFLPQGQQSASLHREEEDSSDVNDAPVPTIIGKVEEIMLDDATRKWTVPAMLAHLRHINFPLAAQKPEATLGQVFVKLQRRGAIRIVRRGSGRNPNIYRASIVERREETTDVSKSERATEGQPVAVH